MRKRGEEVKEPIPAWPKKTWTGWAPGVPSERIVESQILDSRHGVPGGLGSDLSEILLDFGGWSSWSPENERDEADSEENFGESIARSDKMQDKAKEAT